MAETSHLYVFDPIEITVLDSSTVSETWPYAEWSAGTTYAIGNRVAHAASRSFYQAAAASTGVNPSTDTTGKWVRMGANMRWRAFDLRITDPVQTSSSLAEYMFFPPEVADCVAIFGVRCDKIDIGIVSPTEGSFYVKTIDCANTQDIVDAYTYFFAPPEYRTEAILNDLPIFAGYKVILDFYCSGAGATPEIGEIALGRNFHIGQLLSGGSAGIVDYSQKERDVFGNVDIIERAYSDSAEFVVQIPSNRVNLVKRTLAALRAKPAVYHAGPDYIDFGQTIYGFYKDLNVEISGNTSSTVTLQIEGLS